MITHLVESDSGLAKCQPNLTSEDVVVFIGNGVLYTQKINGFQCFAVQDDVSRCGVALPGDVESCDQSKLLDLLTISKSSITWY